MAPATLQVTSAKVFEDPNAAMAVTLSVGWTTQGTVAGPFKISVTNLTTTSPPQDFPVSGTGFPPATCTPTFNDIDTFTVTVSDQAGSVTSAAVTLLTKLPSPSLLNYTGDRVQSAWAAVDGAAYELHWGTSGGTTNVQKVNVGETNYDLDWTMPAFTTPPKGLPSPYFIYLVAQDSQNVAASVSRTYYLLATCPTPTRLFYDGANLNADWDAVQGADGYVLSYGKVNNPPQTTPTTTTLTLKLPWAISGPGTQGRPSDYLVSVTATYGSVVSSSSDVSYLIADAPSPTLFQNNGTSVDLAWALVARTDGTTAKVTTLGVPTSKNIDAPVTTTNLNITPQPASTMTLQAYMSGGVILGPLTTALSPITQSGTLQALAYSGTTIEVDWTPFTDTPVIDAVEINVPGHPMQTGPAQGPYSFPMALTQGTGAVTVRAKSGAVLVGPTTSGLVPIVNAPPSAKLTWDGADLIAQWEVITGEAVPEYQVEFLKDGAIVKTQMAPAPPQKTPITALEDNKKYQAQVRGNSGAVKGPPSPLVNGPFKTAVTWSNDVQGRLVGETWTTGETISYDMDPQGNILSIAKAVQKGGKS